MTNIFDSYDLGGLELPNRIVMAPLTRSRAASDIADEMTALYYTRRSTARLIISEGTRFQERSKAISSIRAFSHPSRSPIAEPLGKEGVNVIINTPSNA
jgi:2,4-dienoyl-CoA reductase-like NADH-dependent reductase (Old Yellow Enzyme family)